MEHTFIGHFTGKIPGNRWKTGSPVFPIDVHVPFTSFCKESPVPDVFERRTSNGSGLFAILSRDFKQIFSLYKN